MIDEAKPAWVVRAGRYGERDAWCLDENVVGGGWAEVPDITGCESRSDVERVVGEVYGTEKPASVAVNTGQLWALRGRIKPGDTVVLPLKTTSCIAIGTCTSGYRYDADAPEDRRIRLGVKWVRTDVPRSAVKQDLLYTLGSALTVFQPTRNEAVRRIAELSRSGTDPGVLVPWAPPNNAEWDDVDDPELNPDVEEVARDRIVAYIAENFAGHRLSELVAAILEAKGFVCEAAGPGPDGGIDVVAGRGPLGLDSPKLIVQVKSGDSPGGRRRGARRAGIGAQPAGGPGPSGGLGRVDQAGPRQCGAPPISDSGVGCRGTGGRCLGGLREPPRRHQSRPSAEAGLGARHR